jgi:flagellar capping protein FliD
MDFASELKGRHVLVFVENDVTPGQFDQVCFFAETFSYTSDKQTSTYTTRDCAQPDKPPVTRTEVQSISDSMSGTGHVKNSDTLKRMDDWHYSDSNKKVELRTHQPNADGTIGALVSTFSADAKLAISSREYDPAGPIVLTAALAFQDTPARVYA